MKRIYSRAVHFIVLLIFCLTKSILAQTYQQEADQVMQPLNKSYVTTGILYDRVFALTSWQSLIRRKSIVTFLVFVAY